MFSHSRNFNNLLPGVGDSRDRSHKEVEFRDGFGGLSLISIEMLGPICMVDLHFYCNYLCSFTLSELLFFNL